MPWKIRWTDTAIRDLRSLDRAVARRIIDRLERASTNPEHYFERLVGSDERKLRVGDFRLLAAFSPSRQIIVVERVDHRRRIYQR